MNSGPPTYRLASSPFAACNISKASPNRGAIVTPNGTGRLVTPISGGRTPCIGKESEHLHDEPIINAPVNVDIDILAIRPTLGLDVHGPQHDGHLDKEHVIGNMTPGTDAPSKPKCDVSLVLGIRRCRCELSGCGVDMSCGIEQMGVGAEGGGVPVDGPDVGDEKRALGDEVALVPKVRGRCAREADGVDGAPSD
jgi:hypothetical protein